MFRSRHTLILLLALLAPMGLNAQEEQPSLGDVAREARKAKAEQGQPEARKVIDDDNFATVLDEAETARLSGKPVFSIDSINKAFRITSPDGTCSLSFDARATSLISTAFVTTDLPQDELSKLEGTASIHDDMIEVSVHNGTMWELREVVIGVTVLQKPVPADTSASDVLASQSKMVSDPTWTGKQPDQTVIYRLRGSAGSKATGTFTAPLNVDSNVSVTPAQDWHWALVSARGIASGNPNLQTASAGSAAASAPDPTPASTPASTLPDTQPGR